MRFTLLCLISLFTTIGCSGIANNVRMHAVREQTLLRAGFKPLPISTPQQQEQLEKLPSGKLTTLQHNGKTYYVYPDLKNHRMLVGRNREFMQYNELVTDQLTPPLKKKDRELEREWEESGVWDNMGGWDSVGWDNPSFLAY